MWHVFVYRMAMLSHPGRVKLVYSAGAGRSPSNSLLRPGTPSQVIEFLGPGGKGLGSLGNLWADGARDESCIAETENRAITSGGLCISVRGDPGTVGLRSF